MLPDKMSVILPVKLRLASSSVAMVVALLFAPAARIDAQAVNDSAPPAHSPRTPISIGNYPNVTGLRINFRDRNLERVNGANVTIWFPYSPARGTVSGLALGLPATGARNIHGLAIAPIGV